MSNEPAVAIEAKPAQLDNAVNKESMNMERQAAYIQQVREAASGILTNLEALFTLQLEFNYGAYGDKLSEQDGISKEIIGAAVFDTANALKAVLDNGHGANLVKLRE